MILRSLLRTLVGSGVVAVALVVGAAPTLHAEPAPPSDKCDDLQVRCLHREAEVCRMWQSQCLTRRPAATRGSHAKKHAGRKRHV
ncbi:MAG: hypothetical protein HY271_05045 [Deltaproteobacteria bacterium]|nr:hypothetical protein [Deltaproteobacteria bacterium]